MPFLVPHDRQKKPGVKTLGPPFSALIKKYLNVEWRNSGPCALTKIIEKLTVPISNKN